VEYTGSEKVSLLKVEKFAVILIIKFYSTLVVRVPADNSMSAMGFKK
jgi:hypothetical protein